MRCKIAALLALLDGRTQVTAADWALAATMGETSCTVRDDLVLRGREEARRIAEQKANEAATLAVRTAVATVGAEDRRERIARQLASKFQQEGGWRTGKARRVMAGRDRPLYTDRSMSKRATTPSGRAGWR